MTVTLRTIDRDNWRECIGLRVAPHQEAFVASNVYSLAQAKAQPECVPLAIYDDDRMVGFVMYALDADEHKYWIYRLMIDAAYQGRGYGRAAMLAVLARLRAEPDGLDVAISYEPENTAAEGLYRSLGFRTAGEISGTEIVARLRLVS